MAKPGACDGRQAKRPHGKGGEKMNMQFECIPCSINSYLRLVKTGVIPEALQEPILRRLLKLFSRIEYDG